MGNAAGKEYRGTEVSDAVAIIKDEALSIEPSLVTKEPTQAECKGKEWINSETNAFLWGEKQVGTIHSHSLIRDEEKNTIATVITAKMKMTSVLNFVCKSNPTFEGQDPLTDDELKKAGIEEGTVIYGFSKIDTSREMTTASSTYSIVTGKDADGELTFETLYTGEKLSAMGLLGIIKEGDTPIAKVKTSGIKMKKIVESAVGVDLLAVVLIGYTLASNDGAGGLAGAGVY